MDKLNDYVFLNMEEINEMLSVWGSNRLVEENLEFEYSSKAKRFTIRVVGIKRDQTPDGEMKYVVQEREYDPESKRFMYQYFLGESVGTEGPLVLTKKILIRPFTSMLIDETSRLIEQGHIVQFQIKHDEFMRQYQGFPELYVATLANPGYSKELFTKVANEYVDAIRKFRNLVYDVFMQYNDK